MMGLWNGWGLGLGKNFLSKDTNGLPIEKEKKLWRMGDAYDKKMVHHEGIKQLWESKWKFPCSKGVYPFHDGKFEDFEPVFLELIKGRLPDPTVKNINDGTSTAYTQAFFPAAAALTKLGDEAADPQEASKLYLRAACLYRIARFPYITSFPAINDPTKWQAWTLQKEVYLKAASKWKCPMSEVLIPHLHRSGEDREVIPMYVRLPKSEGKVPAVLLMTGLDGYRPDNTGRSDEFLSRGWASVIVEVPGMADCPVDTADPESSERLWSSVLDWMEHDGRFEMGRVLVWGLSAGGYHAVRAAHTYKDRLRGVVAQGAGVHEFFGREWIEKADGHEYPFLLSPAMAMKHGYGSVEEYKVGAQKKFSLLEAGMLDKPCARLLLINGTHDGLMPIEDSMLLLEHGSAKEARFFDKALHMGYPMANLAVYPWMESVMA